MTESDCTMEKLIADMHELTDVYEFIKIVEYYKNGLKPDNPEYYFSLNFAQCILDTMYDRRDEIKKTISGEFHFNPEAGE
jgi:hypothetical protein